MKLSDYRRLAGLVEERNRIRESIQSTYETDPDEIKIEIRGARAQGVQRDRLVTAMREGWDKDLTANTEALKKIGVQADDPYPDRMVRGSPVRMAS